MCKIAAEAKCDICGQKSTLSKEQRESYKRIPAKIDPVWHPCFDDADAKARFFGPKAKQIASPQWRLFPEVPEDAKQTPHGRKGLSKADEADLFLRYNYARLRLSKLAERQHRRGTKSRALAMLAWHDRTQKVRGDLAAANMSLVVAMAKRTRIPGVDFPDLISEGNMALLRAIEKFDVSRGFKFSTYACRAIIQGFNHMASRMARYQSRFGAPYDPDLERSDHDVHKHKMQRATVVEDLREIVAKNLAQLSGTERTVVIERFGLARRRKGKTLLEVGKMVGLSNERVRQVQKQALAKIREVFNEHYTAA